MGTHPIFESDFDCLTDDANTLPGSVKSCEQVELIDRMLE